MCFNENECFKNCQHFIQIWTLRTYSAVWTSKKKNGDRSETVPTRYLDCQSLHCPSSSTQNKFITTAENWIKWIALERNSTVLFTGVQNLLIIFDIFRIFAIFSGFIVLPLCFFFSFSFFFFCVSVFKGLRVQRIRKCKQKFKLFTAQDPQLNILYGDIFSFKKRSQENTFFFVCKMYNW